MPKYLKNNKKGSVLVFSIFVMMISLIIGVSLMSTVMIQRKSTLSTAKSVNSFQVADSGLEYVFWKVRNFTTVKILDTDAFELRDIFSGANECVGGVVSGEINGGEYDVYFYTDILTSTSLMTNCQGSGGHIFDVRRVKSVGTYNGITRSVEADVDFSKL